MRLQRDDNVITEKWQMTKKKITERLQRWPRDDGEIKQRLQRNDKKITKRLQRDDREMTESLKIDNREIKERQQRDIKEITERLQREYKKGIPKRRSFLLWGDEPPAKPPAPPCCCLSLHLLHSTHTSTGNLNLFSELQENKCPAVQSQHLNIYYRNGILMIYVDRWRKCICLSAALFKQIHNFSCFTFTFD